MTSAAMRSTAPSLVLTLSLVLGAAHPVAAQEGEQASDAGRQRPRLESITVTARKQEEDQQTIPVAVSTLTGEDFTEQSLQLFEDIELQTPGLSIRQTVGRKHILGAQVRGMFEVDSLITTDPAVGFYIDDIYSARISGVNLSLFDLDRIETLKGPQGVLYGKNNIGGAIKVYSKKPDGSTGGFARIRLGTENQTDFEGALSFPILGEALSARVAFLSYHRDGVLGMEKLPASLCSGPCAAAASLREPTDGYENNALGGRATILYAPSDRWETLFQFERVKVREPDSNPARLRAWDPGSSAALLGRFGSEGFGIAPGTLPPEAMDFVLQNSDRDDGYLSFGGNVDIDSVGYTLNNTLDLDRMTVKLLSGWRKFKTMETRDNDGTPWALRHTRSTTLSKQFTQELQLTGTLLEDRLSYTTGLYWNNERTGFEEGAFGGNPPVFILGFAEAVDPLFPTDTVAVARGWGAYAHGSYALTERLDFWAGIRTTYDRREMRRFFSDSQTTIRADRRYDAVTWGTGLDLQLTDDHFLYAKVEKGFRAGGVNGRGSIQLFNLGQLDFDPEFLTSYEVGAKTEWLDSRVRANLAAYYMRYKDIQTTIFIPAGATSITSRGNSGSADVSGGELEISAVPTPGLELTGGIAVNYFRYVNGLLSGGPANEVNRLGGRQERGTPELQLSAGARYSFAPVEVALLGDVGVTARVDYAWRSKMTNESQNCEPDVDEGGSVEVNPCPWSPSALDQGARGLLSGRLIFELPEHDIDVALWGRNLLDREYEVFVTNFNTTGFLGFLSTNYGEPRRFGVDITYRFGSEAR